MSSKCKTTYQALKDKLNNEVLKEERKYPLRKRERMLVDIITELLDTLDYTTRTGTTVVYIEEENQNDEETDI